MIRELQVLSGALVCAITASVWLSESGQPSTQANASIQPDVSGYDHFVDTLHITHWSTDGQADHYLEASRMEHYPDRQTAVLINPRLRTNTHHEPFWSVTAGKAWLPDNSTVIQLDSQVVLTTRNQSGAQRTLYTEQMQVDTSQNLAYGDLPVRIVSISGIVAGTGFHADLNTQRMELHKQVRSEHE